MFINIEHFKPPCSLTKFYIGFTRTHTVNYGGGSYNFVNNGKEAIQGGTSETVKLLLLISLKNTFQLERELITNY